jgi:hypothetical protein
VGDNQTGEFEPAKVFVFLAPTEQGDKNREEHEAVQCSTVTESACCALLGNVLKADR